eukprot:COSAG01_NODE_2269_length_8033_cov_30.452609_3_plen_57_part_00
MALILFTLDSADAGPLQTPDGSEIGRCRLQTAQRSAVAAAPAAGRHSGTPAAAAPL